MARTKQTAQKSVGGVVPLKPLKAKAARKAPRKAPVMPTSAGMKKKYTAFNKPPAPVFSVRTGGIRKRRKNKVN